jgi:hypothetical protein
VVLNRPSDAVGPPDSSGERESRPERAGGDVPDRRSEAAGPVRPAEWRTRAEYCDVMRAADCKKVDEADERGGWKEIDAADRPPADGIRMTPERTTHILDGDGTGGGHRPGTGKPGKTEFPASWDEAKIVDAIVGVARRPDQKPEHQQWNDRWVARGTRDDVGIVAVLARDGRIWTSWPTPDSPGVVKNPKES